MEIVDANSIKLDTSEPTMGNVVPAGSIKLDTVELPPEVLQWSTARPKTLGERFSDWFSPNDGAERAKASNALVYSNMFNISPAQAYDFHDEISKQVQAKVAGEKIFTQKQGTSSALSGGWDTSLVGMMVNQKVPKPFESVSQMERWLHDFTTMFVDIPFYMAGGLIGGGPVAGPAGAFGFTHGLRQILMDRYSKGEVKDFKDFAQRVNDATLATVKGEVIGAFTGGAGMMAKPLWTKMAGDTLLPPIGWTAMNEIAAMTTASSLMEGKIPTSKDIVDNAVLLLMMHGAGRGYSAVKAKIAEVKPVIYKLQEIYTETGVHPKVVVAEVINRPPEANKDITEILDEIKPELKASAPKEIIPEEKTATNTPQSTKQGEGTTEVPPAPKETSTKVYETTGEGMTGIKNAVVDAERIARGEAPIERPIRPLEEGWEKRVEEEVDRGTIDPKEIAEKVANLVDMGESPASLNTEANNHALKYYKTRLENEMLDVERALKETEGAEKALLEQRRGELLELIDSNEHATTALGTSWSDIGRIRQEMMNSDYTLAGMIRKLKDDGVTITPEVREKYAKIAEEFRNAEKEVDNVKAEKTTRDLEKTVKQIKNEESLAGRKEVRKEERSVLDAEFDTLLKKSVSLLSRQSAGADPEAIKVLGLMMTNRIKSGISKGADILDSIHTSLVNAGIEISKRELGIMLSDYGKQKFMSQEELKVAVREARRQIQLVLALDDAKAGLAPMKSGLKRDEQSDLVRQLTREVKQAMRESGVDTKVSPEAQWKSRLDAVKRQLENRKADILKIIEDGGKGLPEKEKIQYDESTKTLQAEVKLLDNILKNIVEPSRDQAYEPHGTYKEQKQKEPTSKKEPTFGEKEEKALKAIDKSIGEYLRKIEQQDLGPKEKSQLESEKLQSARQTREDLKDFVKELREGPKKSPEDTAIDKYLKLRERQIVDYETRIQEGRFAPKEKTTRDLSDRELEVDYRLNQVKEKFIKERAKDQIAKMGLAGKIGYGALQSALLVRTMKTAFDFSAVLRQGAVIGFGAPILAAKRIPDMFRMTGSPQEMFRLMDSIKKDPRYKLMKDGKLELTDLNQTMRQMEEQFMGRYVEAIPTWLGGGLIRGSQRAYTGYLNLIRADKFNAMVDAWGENGKVTKEQANRIAMFINEATGRGTISKEGTGISNAFIGLNSVFFAPRLVLSQFQLLAGHSMWAGKGTLGDRMLIAKEYAKSLTGFAIVLGLGMAAGGEVEFDSRSSDFVKIKFGNTRIDPFAGLAQSVVLLSRLGTGKTKTIGGQLKPLDKSAFRDEWGVITNFLESKLAPIPGTAVNLITGKDVVGNKVTMYDIPEELLLPLSFGDIYEAMTDAGIPGGAALGTLSLFGMNLNTIDPLQRR